jgi:hypothetical protein
MEADMSHPDDDDGPIDRSLIDAARPGLEPSAGDKARVRRAVLGAIAGGVVASGAAGAQAAAGGTIAAGGTTAAATTTTIAGAGLGAGLATKVVLGAIALASVIGVVAVRTSEPGPPDVAVTLPAESRHPSASEELVIPGFDPEPVAPAAEPIEAPPEVALAPITAEPPIVRPRAPSGSVAEPLDPVLDETRLIAGAQEAIERHDGRGAMALLAEHARRFPEGQLREERFAFRVSALCELGETERARREATSFLDVFPVSVHAPRVRSSCAGEGD